MVRLLALNQKIVRSNRTLSTRVEAYYMKNYVTCKTCKTRRNSDIAKDCPICKNKRSVKVISSAEERGTSKPKVTGSNPVSPTKCSHKETEVIDVRSSRKGIRRRRKCKKCRFKFTTYENILGNDLKLKKEVLLLQKTSEELMKRLLKISELL